MQQEGTGKKLGMLAAVLVVLFFLSFLMGRYPVLPAEVLRVLTGQERDNTLVSVVLQIRLPRILLACLIGACLSAAGTAYQGVFQNPMAAPDILGASAGAAFGAALAILQSLSGQWVTLLAFAGSLLAVLIAYIVGQRARGRKVVNLVLSGVMVSSLFSAGTSYIKLVADPTNVLPAITYWLMGSLSGVRLPELGGALVPMSLGLLALWLIRWRVNVLAFGDEEARTMGVNASAVRLAVIVAATLLTAASVSLSGMIGWVGLVIPHLSRRLVGNDFRRLLPASVLMGAAFLLTVDNVSRNLLATEIPIGILTAFVGVPFFLYLMCGEERFA